MIYRKANKNDYDQLVQRRINYLVEDNGTISEIHRKQIEKQLPIYYDKHLNKDMYAYVAEDNGVIFGTAYLVIYEKPANPAFIAGKIGDVMSVYTCKEKRRCGIAKRLMNMLLEDAEKLSLDYVELEATSDGLGLYEVLGFQKSIRKYIPMKYIIWRDE